MAQVSPTHPTSDPLPRIQNPGVLLAFRAVWLLFASVALVVTLVSIPAYIRTCNCTPETVAQWEALGIAQTVRIIFTTLTALNMAILLALAALIFWRRPDDAMAMYVALTSLIQGVFLVSGPAGSSASWYQAVRLITNFLTPLSWIGLFFLFPNGRFFPGWTKWLLLALVVIPLIAQVLPIGVRSAANSGELALTLIGLVIGLWALIYRYRHMPTSTQRQQIKWTLYALGMVVAVMTLVLPIQFLLRDPTAQAIFIFFRHIILAVVQMLVPASIAFAMLRYGLWDIDLAVNRVLVSAIVTLALVVLFALEFLLTQAVLVNLLHVDQPYVAVAIPAALTAGLFDPTRKRIRHIVDRNLYGFRFDLNELAVAQREPPITNPGLLTGRTLGNYKLLDIVGEGGMGEIYKGVGNNQTVAVKILPLHLAERPDLRARFEREAHALTALDHPNIVKFYDYGSTKDTDYLVMELVDGEELTHRIKQAGKLSLDEVRVILNDIASALDYAHAHGFVHRDIKPSNVMQTRDPATGQAKAVLMDFGIAKIQDGRTSITGSGAVGTIEYMSPEQIMSAHEVDHRTDIYGLGVMLYQMITGELPYKGGVGQMLFAHLQNPIPDPRALAPELPRGIAQAVRRALAKNPEDRFQTAGELAVAFQQSVPVMARAEAA